MILPPEKLTAAQRKHLEQICQGSSELRSTYLLSQEFVTMLKNREASSLDGWLKRAKESHVSQLNSFVNGISRDYAAVRAAFSLLEQWNHRGACESPEISEKANVWPSSSRPVTCESPSCSVGVLCFTFDTPGRMHWQRLQTHDPEMLCPF